MTTAIDTNVLVALWNEDDALNTLARSALDAALGRGRLVISAPVFAELLAAPSRNEGFLDSFCQDTGISVDWELSEAIWRAAGRAFQTYANRRRSQRTSGPRRILADFLIGAHAVQRGYRLLTLDDRLYRAAFPRLSIVTI
ncbi:MAG TPA: type II toxin-antitoxin system VapC family toxin [Candidatus Acidoferrales bacterium]